MRKLTTIPGSFYIAPLLLILLPSISSSQAAPSFEAIDQQVRVAQAGSAGGTLGNDEKSVSGGQGSAVRKVPAKAPPVAKKAVITPVVAPTPNIRPHLVRQPNADTDAASTEPERRPRTHSVSLSSYDGTYAGASTGPCILRWSWSFRVENGIMTGDSGSNIAGQINQTGSAVGKMSVFGTTYDFVGHLTATGASGTWIKPGSGGCTGTWSATK